MKNIIFNSYSMLDKIQDGDKWYDWCIFVDEDKSVIDSIVSVQYTLHPSFPNPVRVSTDKYNRFVLYSGGWGGFNIQIEVVFTNGDKYSTVYYLRLHDDNWPKIYLNTDDFDEETIKVYNAMFHEKYKSRKIDTIVKITELEQSVVENILEILQEKNIVRKQYFKTVDNKDIWGATAVLGISPKNE